jgi:hypothetical protein
VHTYGMSAKNRARFKYCDIFCFVSMCDVPCPSLLVCAMNISMYDVPCPSLWVCAINRSMYDVPCPSLCVCAINRYMYDVPCPNLWGFNRSDYTILITTDVVSTNLDLGEVYKIKWWSLSVTCDRSVVFSGCSGLFHQ